jgi:sulfur-oxidizing protein SoxX
LRFCGPLAAALRIRNQQPDFDCPMAMPIKVVKFFLYMQCNQCHTIKGIELPAIPYADPAYVELGGRVATVKTYGDLVTSVINPSHRLAPGYAKENVSEDGESNMYTYNRHMTVQELIDLVAFLQSHYDVVPPQFDYRVYPR